MSFKKDCTDDCLLEIHSHDLVCLQWPSPPRNVLVTKKLNEPTITESLIEYCSHIQTAYPGTYIIAEPHTADEIHDSLPSAVYTTQSSATLASKVDLISTLGGDGTILRAASLFANTPLVPPVLSFGMGTLGFLGEWKIHEYKRAFREVFMSGANLERPWEKTPGGHSEAGETTLQMTDTDSSPAPGTTAAGWSSVRGKFMGSSRLARVLLRNRLRVGVFDASGARVNGDNASSSVDTSKDDVYAMNEVIVHRGSDPHLAIVEVYVGGRFLTEAVADGMIISSPTGSTAYNLSANGSIVHPLVPSLLLTPICPRSLSFRPLVLPANTPITLRISPKTRGREVEISIDGVRVTRGAGVGMEVRVLGEEIRDPRSAPSGGGGWGRGGVPSIVRGYAGAGDGEGEDHWVGGLNALLKFNYPFGEEG